MVAVRTRWATWVLYLIQLEFKIWLGVKNKAIKKERGLLSRGQNDNVTVCQQFTRQAFFDEFAKSDCLKTHHSHLQNTHRAPSSALPSSAYSFCMPVAVWVTALQRGLCLLWWQKQNTAPQRGGDVKAHLLSSDDLSTLTFYCFPFCLGAVACVHWVVRTWAASWHANSRFSSTKTLLVLLKTQIPHTDTQTHADFV